MATEQLSSPLVPIGSNAYTDFDIEKTFPNITVCAERCDPGFRYILQDGPDNSATRLGMFTRDIDNKYEDDKFDSFHECLATCLGLKDDGIDIYPATDFAYIVTYGLQGSTEMREVLQSGIDHECNWSDDNEDHELISSDVEFNNSKAASWVLAVEDRTKS